MSDHVAAQTGTTSTATEIEPRGHALLTRMAAEAAGTFILVFIGLGALLYSGTLREVDPLINALAFGVAFAAATAVFARVSGGHINPAISLGAAIRGHLGWADLPAYWLGQIAGGLGAAAVLFLTLPAGLSAQLGVTDQALFTQAANTYGDQSYLAQISGGEMSFGLPQVLVLEALAAAILTAVVLAKSARAHVVPVVAGLTLTGLVLALEPVTGASVNPARSTAAAIFAESAALGQLWLFWLAPLIGGAVAGLAFLLFAPAATEPAWDDDWASGHWADDDGGRVIEGSPDPEQADPEQADEPIGGTADDEPVARVGEDGDDDDRSSQDDQRA